MNIQDFKIIWISFLYSSPFIVIIGLIDVFLLLTNKNSSVLFFLIVSIFILTPIAFLTNLIIIATDKGSELYKYDIIVMNYITIGISELFAFFVFQRNSYLILGVKIAKSNTELFVINIICLIILGLILVYFSNKKRKDVILKITDKSSCLTLK